MFLSLSIAILSIATGYSKVYDVTQSPYYADNTGSLDASPAINKAIEDAITEYDQGVHLHFPAGTYKVNSRISVNPYHCTANNGKSFGMTVTGDGPVSTIINVDNFDGFFQLKIDNSLSRNMLTVKGLKIVALRAGIDCALEHSMPKIGSGNRNVCFRDLAITGGEGKGFATGIKLYGSWWPYLENVSLSGYTSLAHQYWMWDGLLMEDAYSPYLNNIAVTNASNAIVYSKKTEGVNVEDGCFRGLHLSNVKNGVLDYIEPFVNPDTGIPQWEEVGFHLQDSRINYKENGIVLWGQRQAHLNNNIFECYDSSGTRYDIRMITNASTLVIDENSFTGYRNPNVNRRSVELANLSSCNLIRNNYFDIDGIAVENRNSDGKHNHSAGNIFDAATQPYYDENASLIKLGDYDLPTFGYWGMDDLEGSGTVANIAYLGNANSLTLDNGAHLVAGQYSNALDVDGVNDYAVSANNWAGADSVNIDTWIRLDRVVGNQFIVSVANAFRLNAYGASMNFRWKNQNGVWQTALSVPGMPAGTWLHVMAGLLGDDAWINVEGMGQASTTSAGGLYALTGEKVYLGSMGGNGYWLDGQIDELKITEP